VSLTTSRTVLSTRSAASELADRVFCEGWTPSVLLVVRARCTLSLTEERPPRRANALHL